jgi:hypothetical protein
MWSPVLYCTAVANEREASRLGAPRAVVCRTASCGGDCGPSAVVIHLTWAGQSHGRWSWLKATESCLEDALRCLSFRFAARAASIGPGLEGETQSMGHITTRDQKRKTERRKWESEKKNAKASQCNVVLSMISFPLAVEISPENWRFDQPLSGHNCGLGQNHVHGLPPQRDHPCSRLFSSLLISPYSLPSYTSSAQMCRRISICPRVASRPPWRAKLILMRGLIGLQP